MNEKYLIDEIINNKIDPNTIIDKLAICDFRKQIYHQLHENITDQHADLVRFLLKIEIIEREKDEYDEDVVFEDTYDFEAFYWCIFLLSRIGEVQDVFTIWHAKYIDFDASIGVDWQFLMGAGYDETISFLESNGDELSLKILTYLRQGDLEDTEQENLQKWYDFRYRYFLN